MTAPGSASVALLAAGVLAVAAVFAVADPSASAWFPKCLFHALTGLYCPGCGVQRALHALAHGRLADAVGYNALATLSLPWMGLAAASWATGRRPPWRQPAWIGPAVLVAVVAFWVLRNVPAAPFAALAP